MRLIDADALMARINHDTMFSAVLEELIEEQPPIDAVSDKHCKNVGTDYADVDQFVCSECGLELQEWVRVERDEDDGEVTHHEYVFRYCPHCGARIDEE